MKALKRATSGHPSTPEAKRGGRKPIVSMLMITFNELPHLKEVLADLKRQTLKELEIIVCDNGSQDGTEAFVRTQPGIKYVNAHRNMATGVFNLGLPLAQGDFVFIGATDMKFDPDCLQILVDFLEKNPHCGQAVPVNYNGNHPGRIDVGGSWLSRGFYGGALFEKPQQPLPIPFCGVGLVRLSALRKAGGFLYEPSYFLYGEDVDLGFRLWRSGYSTEMVPPASLTHYGYQSRKFHSRFRLTLWVEKNMITTMVSHLPLRYLIFSYPYAFLLRLAVLAKDLIRLDGQRAAARIAALGWMVAGLPYMLLRRHTMNETLKNPFRQQYFHSGFFTETHVRRLFLRAIK